MSIEVRTEEGLATIILNRPEKKNALTLDMRIALGDQFERLARDTSVRAVLLTANGETFDATAMAGFALSSSAGLWAAPWVWNRALAGRGAVSRERWAVRAAGALLVAGSGWALWHGVWQQVAAFCGIG